MFYIVLLSAKKQASEGLYLQLLIEEQTCTKVFYFFPINYRKIVFPLYEKFTYSRQVLHEYFLITAIFFQTHELSL